MLQDSSPDFQDTWDFLDNRIQDVVNMATTAKQVESLYNTEELQRGHWEELFKTPFDTLSRNTQLCVCWQKKSLIIRQI